MSEGQFIVLTGIDAAGKDYIAKCLHASDSRSKIVQTPTEPFLNCRQDLDALTLTIPTVHYLFYLASVIHASTLIENTLAAGKNVYCVRYLIDTVVYHRALGLNINLEYETPLYHIRKPDLTVFLAVKSEKIRQERLRIRGTTVGDMIINKKQLRNAILSEYKRLSEHFILVDNTERDVSEVVAEIRNYF